MSFLARVANWEISNGGLRYAKNAHVHLLMVLFAEAIASNADLLYGCADNKQILLRDLFSWRVGFLTPEIDFPSLDFP